MKKQFKILINLCVILITATLHAVVLHNDIDAPVVHPEDSVVGRWATSGSCVAIGRSNWEKTNYIITTRHQGGGVNTSVYFNGTEYKVAEQWLNGPVDMRICRLETTTASSANLTNFVSWYTGTNEVSKSIVISGFGKSRGAAGADVEGSYYEWTGTNNHMQRWGKNTIASAMYVDVGAYQSDVLVIYFGNILSKDCAVAQWDSGGGWFVNTASSPETNWRLVALNGYVQHNGKSYYMPGDSNLGIRIGSYTAWINSIIPATSESATLLQIAND